MAETPAQPAESLRRLHPFTIVVEFARLIGRMAYPLLLLFFLRFTRGRADWIELAVAALAGLGTFAAVARYLVLRYGITEDRLVIRSGVFVRQVRTIPLDKIQNINLKRGVLHRILGVVDMQIETAASGKAEAALSVLSEAQAARLREELLSRRTETEEPSRVGVGAAASQPTTLSGAANSEHLPVQARATLDSGAASNDGELLWRATASQLFIAGATANRAGAIIAAVAGLWYFLNDAASQLVNPLIRALETAIGSDPRSTAWITAGLIVSLILVGWLASIVLTFVEYGGFTLRRTGRQLRAQYGLLTHIERVIPPRRVQLLRTEAPLVRRLLGFRSVYAETAGSAMDAKAGTSTPLSPLVEDNQLPGFCRHVFPNLDMASVAWRRVSHLTIRRGFVRLAAVGAVVVAAIFYWSGNVGWLFAPIAVGVAALFAWLRYLSLGYARMPGFLLIRAGIWKRKTWLIPDGKIQWVSLHQTPFQARLNLASLAIGTAASQMLSGPTIVDLPLEHARALQDQLSQSTSAAGLWMLDGV